MQAIEIQADITPEGNISLPSPYKNLYGRQARLILLVEEIATSGESLAKDPVQAVHEQLREDPSGERLTHEMDKVWDAWRELSGEGEEEEIFNQALLISRIQAALPSVIAIYALGERIEKGSGTLGVPLELAILMEGEAEPLALWSLSKELSTIAHCRVELLDLRVSAIPLQYQVVTTAERWWSSNPRAGLFECFVLSEKSALDESRPSLGSPILPTLAEFDPADLE
ncbi:MAG: hypothetical protein HQM01_12020 [Magnetococcales bacterium]|nr:hypothetical protein [Magnetococcales bacterium]